MIKLGENINLDLKELISTRLLVQANSGGGKSYAIRKLLEETHGKVQQIVLDMEGEFGTLRENLDYVLAGKGGDVPADPKSAAILAKKVLEMEVSLIVDLYELKKPERIRFVRNFLEALVNAPKELWHSVLVVIDEAHVFVPEKGESEAASAVIDLASRGRKRGFACVLATQRLSKLNKDVAAECLNKLIGRTSLDIDRKRAADELGFLNQKDSLELREMAPGEFFLFGPALSNKVQRGRIGAVKTTHPKAGQRLGFKQIKPTEHIKSILKKLTDLPQEAEKELKEKADFQKRIRELEIQVKNKPAQISKEQLDAAYQKGLMHGQQPIKRAFDKFAEVLAHISKDIERATEIRAQAIETLASSVPQTKIFQPAVALEKRVTRLPVRPGARVFTDETRIDRRLGQCERKILGFLSIKPGEFFTKVQVGAMTGYSHGSGGFNNALSALTQMGFIERISTGISLKNGVDVSEFVSEQPHRLEDWIAKLGACERKIYQTVLENPHEIYPKEALGEVTGYSPGSGGFNNSLSRLNTLGLIRRSSAGVQLNPEVLEI